MLQPFSFTSKFNLRLGVKQGKRSSAEMAVIFKIRLTWRYYTIALPRVPVFKSGFFLIVSIIFKPNLKLVIIILTVLVLVENPIQTL